MRTPSTKTSGWFDSEIEALPRMRIWLAVPTVPDARLMATPGVRAVRSSPTVEIDAFWVMVAASTEATTADCARRSWLPAVPVTTTSDSLTVVSFMDSSWTVVCPPTMVTLVRLAL